MADFDLSALAGVELDDHLGERHRLGDYWAEQPAVLNFLRHFG